MQQGHNVGRGGALTATLSILVLAGILLAIGTQLTEGGIQSKEVAIVLLIGAAICGALIIVAAVALALLAMHSNSMTKGDQ